MYDASFMFSHLPAWVQQDIKTVKTAARPHHDMLTTWTELKP